MAKIVVHMKGAVALGVQSTYRVQPIKTAKSLCIFFIVVLAIQTLQMYKRTTLSFVLLLFLNIFEKDIGRTTRLEDICRISPRQV